MVDATSEFAAGAAQFGGVDALDEAVATMQQAEAALRSGAILEGQTAENSALAALIRARKNMRQMLSMSSSASASQCRTFDRQQQQKLRPPKEQKKQEEQQIAETRQQLEQLAQEQRKWSDEVRSGSGGAQLDRDPQKQQQQQQQEQQQSQSTVEKLAEQMAKSDASSDYSERQMEKAAEAIQDSLEKYGHNDPEAAADAAERAADQLDDLSKMLAALNAADFAQQLGMAQRLAKQLADQQESVAANMKDYARRQSNSTSKGRSSSQGDASKGNTGGGRPGEQGRGASASPSAAERDLAVGADVLAELLALLGAAAEEEDRQVRNALQDVTAENPPQEIAQTMRDAAEDFEQGDVTRATKAAGDAEESLEDIATDLKEVRRQYAEPRLEELIAVEEQASHLADTFEDRDVTELIESEVADVEKRVQSLARSDSQLAKALSIMREGQAPSPSAANSTQPLSGGRGGDSNHEHRPTKGADAGFQRSPTVMGGGLRDVAKVLQNRIQEVILASVVSDADEAVPQEYQDLVEQYYRHLSDDLR